MTRATYYPRMFYAAAIFNWLAASASIGKSIAPGAIPLPTPFDPFGGEVFGLMVAVFGYGYFLVGRDPARNPAVVWMGIVGKFAIFALFLAHTVTGDFPLVLMIPALGDALFGLLFAEFLFAARPRYLAA